MTKAAMCKEIERIRDKRIAEIKKAQVKADTKFRRDLLKKTPGYDSVASAVRYAGDVVDKYVAELKKQNMYIHPNAGICSLQNSLNNNFEERMLNSIPDSEYKYHTHTNVEYLAIIDKYDAEMEAVSAEFEKVLGYIRQDSINAKAAEKYLLDLGFEMPEPTQTNYPAQPVDPKVLFGVRK